MTFLLATVVFPALCVLLGLGAGLLVERVAGVRLPGLLLLPLGTATLISVAQLVSWQAALAPLTPWTVWLIGGIGLIVGRSRLRDSRFSPWAIGATVGAFLVLLAPVILSGRATLAGYLLDTTAGVQLSGAELLLENARDFARLPESSMRGTLEAFFGAGYPTGGHVLLGSVGRPLPVDLLWLYQPYLALMAAMCAPTLFFMLRRGEAPPWFAAAGAFTGSMPALVFAYAQMGAIKEMTVLPLVLLLGALLLIAPELWAGGVRALTPFVVTAAGGVGAIGLAFGAWVGPVALAGVAIALVSAGSSRRHWRWIAPRLAVAGGLGVLLLLPTLASFTKSFGIADSFDQGNASAVADPGNLLRPLLNEQVAGVWLNGTHRSDPAAWFQETYLLIGVVAVAALLGIGWVVRRRLVGLGVFAAVCALVWLLLTAKGTAWTDAKLLVITSPVVMLFAFLGVTNLWRAGLRAAAPVLALMIIGGVLSSNALTYHDTNMAPTARFEELLDINERFAGRGPALIPDFDEFTFHALRDVVADGPGFASRTARTATLADGTPPAYGKSYDLDSLSAENVRAFPAIVMRRSPERSRPPSGFKRAYLGDWYEVWLRMNDTEVVLHHPGGSGLRPVSRIACGVIKRAASSVGPGAGTLLFADRPASIVLDPRARAHSATWPELPEGIGLGAPGWLQTRFTVDPPGTYLLWLKGEFSRSVQVEIDGREVGEVSYESGGDGNYAKPVRLYLDAGRHRLRLTKGGGTLHPGDAAPSRLLAVVITEVTSGDELSSLAASRWPSLCEREIDWLESLRSRG